MDVKSRILGFFEAENRRDWEAYRQYLSPDVVWVLYGRQTRTICGIGPYMEAIRGAYEDNNDTFVCESLHESGDGRRVAVVLRNDFGERSCEVFDFEGELIAREYEFPLG